ncbi:IPTL-CTERM sorting domain-containing protein [Brevundimonas nasdae]|uniref:IPTL-CTERM sorting domain-containing protein n=1 Tax=Brevundimonas nasdae TaxID=172043 RepID=UPI003C6D8108
MKAPAEGRTSRRRNALASLFNLAGVAAVACLALAAPATAQNYVANPSFETPALAPDESTVGSIPDWTGRQNSPFGVAYERAALMTPNVTQWAYTNSGANAIAQRTTKEVVANEVYELTAEFGQRTDNPAVTLTLELWVGGAVTRGEVVGGTLVGTQSVTPVAGQFAPATVRWTAPSAGPWIGQRLSVRLANSSGAQANYDNVSLTATPGVAPVPTLSEWAMILFAAMLGGGASLYLQYRRRLA